MFISTTYYWIDSFKVLQEWISFAMYLVYVYDVTVIGRSPSLVDGVCMYVRMDSQLQVVNFDHICIWSTNTGNSHARTSPKQCLHFTYNNFIVYSSVLLKCIRDFFSSSVYMYSQYMYVYMQLLFACTHCSITVCTSYNSH